MSNRAINRILKENPALYFVVAAAIVGGKVAGLPPTAYMNWALVGLAVAATCALGVFGLRSKAQAKTS